MGLLDYLSPYTGSPFSNTKRKRGSMSGIRAQHKRPKFVYDPKAYKQAGYGSATMTVTDEEESGDDSGSGYKPTEITGKQKKVSGRQPSQTQFLKAVESNALLQKAEDIWEKSGPGRKLGMLDEIKKQRLENDKIIEAVVNGTTIEPPKTGETPKTLKTAGTPKAPKTVSPIVSDDPDVKTVVTDSDEGLLPPDEEEEEEPEDDSEAEREIEEMLKRSKTYVEKLTALQNGPEDFGWDKTPNLRARALGDKKKILAELKEPEYACRDVEIRDALWQIMDKMEKFAKVHFSGPVRKTWTEGQPEGTISEKFYQSMDFETVKLVHCVASGGPSGVFGWHDLFLDEKKRRALVCAIIGKTITEQVFQHQFFGGSKDDLKHCAKIEMKYRDHDGFVRHRHRADHIRSSLNRAPMLPINFTSHVNAVLSALWVHIFPLLTLVAPAPITPLALLRPLQRLIVNAGLTSLHMRLDPHTVYHHAPLFKEDAYDGARMDCFNRSDITIQNPRNELAKCPPEEQARRARLSDTERKRSKGDSVVTCITLLDGVTAYRLGGWEAPSSRNHKVVFEHEAYKRQGVRVRVITQGWVFCRWGRARSAQSGVPANEELEKKLHGDAWREGGWKGFTDVKGVRDWLGEEREERKQANERKWAQIKKWEEELEKAAKAKREKGAKPRSASVPGKGKAGGERRASAPVKASLGEKKVDKGKGRAEVEKGVQDVVIEWSPSMDLYE